MNPVLRFGDKGHYVSALQHALGFTTVDGDFGKLTEIAVKTWQWAHKIPRTGIVTEDVWRSLTKMAPYTAPCLCPVGATLPTTGYMRRHSSSGTTWGVDIPVPVGWPVASPCDGQVLRVSDISDLHNGIGVWIAPSQGPARSIAMIHLSERTVKAGDQVKRGVIIGKSGDTGASQAPHLHLEFYPDGIDPLVSCNWPAAGWGPEE